MNATERTIEIRKALRKDVKNKVLGVIITKNGRPIKNIDNGHKVHEATKREISPLSKSIGDHTDSVSLDLLEASKDDDSIILNASEPDPISGHCSEVTIRSTPKVIILNVNHKGIENSAKLKTCLAATNGDVSRDTGVEPNKNIPNLIPVDTELISLKIITDHQLPSNGNPSDAPLISLIHRDKNGVKHHKILAIVTEVIVVTDNVIK